MKINSVRLMPEEAKWFIRNVMKTTTLLETAAQKDPKTLERSTYKTLASLVPQVTKAAATLYANEDKEPVDLILSKKQKLVVRSIVDSVNRTLNEKVIPEYINRGESHAEYLQKAKDKAEFLTKLSRKFK